MPLLDHFNPPLSRTHPWRSFHSGWAAAMARLLNAGVLPEGYYAVPNVDRDGPVEIDVAALQEPGVIPARDAIRAASRLGGAGAEPGRGGGTGGGGWGGGAGVRG